MLLAGQRADTEPVSLFRSPLGIGDSGYVISFSKTKHSNK